MKHLRKYIWLVIPLCLSPTHFAHAYLDPSSGSFIIQMAIGLIFGATYTLKSFGGKILSSIRNKKKVVTEKVDGEE